MDGAVLLQVAIAGLAQGAIIALVALGFSLVTGTARVLPFAHGDVAVGSILVAVLVVLGSAPTAAALAAWPAVLLVLLSLVVGPLLSATFAALLVLPNASCRGGAGRTSATFGWIAGGLATGLLLRATLGLLLSQQAYAVPDPFRLTATGLLRLPGGATIPVRTVLVGAVGVLIALVAQRAVIGSRFGRSLRAVADDPAGAALCGVSADRAVLGAFLVAGLLASIAGLLAAPERALSVDGGALLGLEAAAAAVLGGIGSLRGAIAGGLGVGVVQALAAYLLGAGFYDVAPLALLVLVLAVRAPGASERRSPPRAFE